MSTFRGSGPAVPVTVGETDTTPEEPEDPGLPDTGNRFVDALLAIVATVGGVFGGLLEGVQQFFEALGRLSS